jgi:hypothetical protein
MAVHPASSLPAFTSTGVPAQTIGFPADAFNIGVGAVPLTYLGLNHNETFVS